MHHSVTELIINLLLTNSSKLHSMYTSHYDTICALWCYHLLGRATDCYTTVYYRRGPLTPFYNK